MSTANLDLYNQQLTEGCSDDPPPPDIPPDTPVPDTFKRPQYPRSITMADQAPGHLNTCPYGSTILLEHNLTGKFYAAGITCNRWACPPCAQQKTRDLAMWTKIAAPNRLLTLTVDPALHDNPELAWLSTAPKIPELIRALRKKFAPVEYLRVVEQTEKGWPHYHCMVRSNFIPQAVIKSEWTNLTGAKIVDIRQVNNFFNSFSYLVKYLTKLRRVDWTERHVTYSRHFFPVGITRPKLETEYHVLQLIPEKHYTYLQEEYHQVPLIQTAPYLFELPSRPASWIPKKEHKLLLEKKQQTLGDF